jgi:hypothetical protein
MLRVPPLSTPLRFQNPRFSALWLDRLSIHQMVGLPATSGGQNKALELCEVAR